MDWYLKTSKNSEQFKKFKKFKKSERIHSIQLKLYNLKYLMKLKISQGISQKFEENLKIFKRMQRLRQASAEFEKKKHVHPN